MKYSLTRRIRGYIVTVFILCLLQVLLLQLTQINSNEVPQSELQTRLLERQKEVQNIDVIFLVLVFIATVMFFFYTPRFQEYSLSDLRRLLQEVARGNYNLNIDTEAFDERNDPAVQELIELTSKAVSTVRHFDQAKKEKITEHLSRIQGMLKLAENGYMILTLEGQVKFISDNVMEVFPVLSSDINIRESNFPAEVDNTVIKYIHGILRSRNKAEAQQFFIPALKRHITLRSSIVRDTGGMPIGVVVALYNLEKKKQPREHEERDHT